MTKGQAIDILQGAIKKPNTKDGYLGQAIDMAINALEQPIQAIQPNSTQLIFEMMNREISEDCVSRAKALSAIRKLYPSAPFVRLNLKKWHEENKKYFECEDIIKALPPVTPARKSGLCWIERFDNESMWLECPHCHIDSIAAYNYCPNCGASFKEEKRGNENEIN